MEVSDQFGQPVSRSRDGRFRTEDRLEQLGEQLNRSVVTGYGDQRRGGPEAFILFHLDYSVRRLRLELFDAHTGRSYGRLLEIDYFPRNSGPDFFYFIPWQGNDSNIEAVPAGDYTLRFSAEKALGQDDNPAHWEVWSSPTVTVLR